MSRNGSDRKDLQPVQQKERAATAWQRYTPSHTVTGLSNQETVECWRSRLVGETCWRRNSI